MASAGEFPELAWTREQLLDLAAKLDAEQARGFVPIEREQTLKEVSNALRYLAALTVQDECRKKAPYKPLYRIRTSDGDIIWTCGHNPPHESPA